MIQLPDPAATDTLGAALAGALQCHGGGFVMSLVGELGAGKTALARAALRALGHTGPVASPTYTLIEPYAVGPRIVYHVDLYRLGDPGELEYLGLRDIDAARDWLWLEWAERGRGYLPAIDLTVELIYVDSARAASLRADTRAGRRVVDTIQNLI